MYTQNIVSYFLSVNFYAKNCGVVCGVNCGVKQTENKPHCSGLFFYTFFLCFELSKLVVYLLSLVVEVFVGVVGIAPVHGRGLYVFVERMPRPEHHRF